MQKIKNCPICGKVYLETGTHMCRNCYDKMQDLENEILNYVRDNPKVTVKEICEATGAKEKMIIRMIREGRFIQSGVQLDYPCEKCGKPITDGRYCPDCAKELSQQVKQQVTKIQAKVPSPGSSGHGMYSQKALKKKK